MVDSNHESQQQPIIVKKKKGGHGGHHGGAWKVAYADFVTAMMAFFLVMWIVGLSPKIKENVAGYFRDPVGFAKGGTKGVLPGGKGPFQKEPGNSMQRNDTREKKEAEVWQSLKDVGKKIQEKLSKMDAFAQLKDQIQIELTPDGLRIQLIDERDKTPFFASGSADMSPEGAEILKTISSEIGKLGYNVVVEGHTDAKSYPGGASYTNWELSADRANTARRLMLSSGVPENKIKEIRGFAANQPRTNLDPVDPGNRRIAIIVLNQYAASNYKEVAIQSGSEISLK